jgi:FkbM family methyltransferase
MQRNLKSYSQNNEDLIVQQLFGSFKGRLLEIGANNGTMLSNSKLLIENDWKAILIEPSSTFAELQLLHKDNPNIICHNIGIGERDEIVTFYESGAHVPAGDDQALVSSVNYDETIRWRQSGVQFEEKKVQLLSWNSFLYSTFIDKFDFISIDVEGLEWSILQQIDLDDIGCKVLCIEYNGDRELFKKFSEYCKGFRLVDCNNENLIFSRI